MAAYQKGHAQEKKKIFIAPFTTPNDVTTIKNSCAVITTGGGVLSHAGITTREYAVASVLVEGSVRTLDLGGSSNTLEMGTAVVKRLRGEALQEPLGTRSEDVRVSM